MIKQGNHFWASKSNPGTFSFRTFEHHFVTLIREINRRGRFREREDPNQKEEKLRERRPNRKTLIKRNQSKANLVKRWKREVRTPSLPSPSPEVSSFFFSATISCRDWERLRLRVRRVWEFEWECLRESIARGGERPRVKLSGGEVNELCERDDSIFFVFSFFIFFFQFSIK